MIETKEATQGIEDKKETQKKEINQTMINQLRQDESCFEQDEEMDQEEDNQKNVIEESAEDKHHKQGVHTQPNEHQDENEDSSNQSENDDQIMSQLHPSQTADPENQINQEI